MGIQLISILIIAHIAVGGGGIGHHPMAVSNIEVSRHWCWSGQVAWWSAQVGVAVGYHQCDHGAGGY